MIRRAESLVFGLTAPVVILDGEMCAELNKLLQLDKLRAQVRGRNAQFDQTLVAIHVAALATGSCASATNFAPEPQPAAQSEHEHDDTLSTRAAAEILKISGTAVRKACKQGRLPAAQVDGRWRIARDDLAEFLTARKEHHHDGIR